jgi:predicted nicotinamide N-methyase
LQEGEGAFAQAHDIQRLDIAGITLDVRLLAYHSHNANIVWPGTFALAEYLAARKDALVEGRVLELGSATGALALALTRMGLNITASDLDELEHEIEQNIRYNFELNHTPMAAYIPHTWGSGWDESRAFDYVVASDILLYVSAYPALVQTLVEIFSTGCREFIMAWNRRMKGSEEFFLRMEAQGFEYTHEGKGVYSFRKVR